MGRLFLLMLPRCSWPFEVPSPCRPSHHFRISPVSRSKWLYCQRQTRVPSSVISLPFDEWTEVFGSERLTGALLDRLIPVSA